MQDFFHQQYHEKSHLPPSSRSSPSWQPHVQVLRTQWLDVVTFVLGEVRAKCAGDKSHPNLGIIWFKIDLSKDVISNSYWYAFTCSHYVFFVIQISWCKDIFLNLLLYICSLTIWLSLGRRFQWLHLVKMFGAWVWLTLPIFGNGKFGTLAFQRKQSLEGCSIFHGPWFGIGRFLLQEVGIHPWNFNMEPEIGG